MLININKSTWTVVTEQPSTLKFSTDTLLTTVSNDSSYELSVSANEDYQHKGSLILYAKSRSDDVAAVEVLPYESIVNSLSGIVIQKVPDTSYENFYGNFNATVAPGDFINISRSSNGQQYVEVSMDPLTPDSETSIEFNRTVQMPMYVEIEASLSQRTPGDYAVMEVTDKVGRDTEPTEYSIVAISQTTSTLTVTLDSAFDGWLGSWVDIYDLLDSRFNYTNAAVATMSIDKKILTINTRDESGLPSLTATPLSVVGGKLKRQSKLQNAKNAVGMRFTGTSTATVAYMSRFDGGSIKEGGTLTGSRLVANASSVPTYTSSGNGQVEIKASSRYRIEIEPEVITFLDKGIDANNGWSTRTSFTAVKPSDKKDYHLRFRAVSPKSITRPVAKIVSAVKATASTTVTITTDVPHGLNPESWVQIYGIRDQTNFPNVTAAVKLLSVINTTSFTIAIAGTTIATSYGGYVAIVNGGVGQTGAISQVIQTVSVDSLGFVTVVGNMPWSGYNGIGEYLNLIGCRNAVNGADLGLDGIYRVVNGSTIVLILQPVLDINNNKTLNGAGLEITPTSGVLATTNCGGALILRTTLRSHDLVTASYSQSVVAISGQGTQRVDKAIPMYLTGGSISSGSISAGQSTAATVSATTGLGGWLVNPATAVIPDIASAALTSTTTSSALANNLGNGFQVNIAVTVLSGTNPTLDIRVEESFDGGVNWVTLYEMQRITAIGSYNSPIMRASGRHIRYIRTVTGTSPSFTHAVNRNILPFVQAEPQKRLMDRTIVLTTLNSVTPTLFQGAANNVQLVVNIGTATTVPTLQLEGSEDGINWYAMDVPLTAIASSTVQLTVVALSATYTRARVSTAGTAVVAGYVSIKAWS